MGWADRSALIYWIRREPIVSGSNYIGKAGIPSDGVTLYFLNTIMIRALNIALAFFGASCIILK